jgi:hypothetical protein
VATFLYINADPATGPQRATQLGCGWVPSTPPQYAAAVASIPAVVVAGQGVVTVLPDAPPTTPAAVASAAAPILAAEQAAAAATATANTNQATIQANIQTHIGQLEAWLTANPNGAVLTAAQTKFVAQTLIGVGRLLLGLTSTVGGAT